MLNPPETNQSDSGAVSTPMAEAWRPISGYDGRYEVSDQGRVRSSSGRQLTISTNAKGYQSVALRDAASWRRRLLHRLVLEAFVGPCPDGKECAHRDGNSRNNTVQNLGWLTRVENAREREMHRVARGLPHHSRKVHADLEAEIKAALGTASLGVIADRLGLCKATVWKVWRAEGHKRDLDHCHKGHAYTPENTFIEIGGQRRCGACRSAARARRAMRAAASCAQIQSV